MATIFGIIIFFVIVTAFPRLSAGIFGAVVLGWLGSLIGEISLIIGAILGFVSGFNSNEGDENSDDTQKERVAPSSSGGAQYTGTKNSGSKCSCGSGKRYENCHGLKKDSVNNQKGTAYIIRCPSCTQKIRIALPLKNINAKCSKCVVKFKIKIDQNNRPYAEKINNSSYAPRDNKFSDEECFKILGILQTSDFSEIKRAYKQRIREYHPDKVGNLGDKLKVMAEEESKSINLAYAVLKEKNGG